MLELCVQGKVGDVVHHSILHSELSEEFGQVYDAWSKLFLVYFQSFFIFCIHGTMKDEFAFFHCGFSFLDLY